MFQNGRRGGAAVGVPYTNCPAKTFAVGSAITLGRTVFDHCRIVGEVAQGIIARYPTGLAKKLFPVGAALTAATHDIGKVSPYFVEKLRQACTPGCHTLPVQMGIDPKLETQWGGHAGVSQVTAAALGAPNFVPEVLGQHHGFSPALSGRRADDEVFGGPLWQLERIALVSELKKHFGSDWSSIESVPTARLLAGLTSVADWIGSGELFENPADPWQGRISEALDSAGFVPPSYQPGLSFEQVFHFQARPAQQQLIAAALGPGVYVLEAPMGIGKTEAALYTAYLLLSSGHASGIYFALPTQLTSNKIYHRFNDFLANTLAADCQHRSLLLHSHAWLLDTEMGEEGRPGGAWFNQAKRGLLAPFAVGTIDQALMAAMNVKHGFVRAFALAGKVVILDEVHTYDAYTGSLLDALVDLLRALHCTVIILTATLSRDRRQQLLGCMLTSDAYPLLTALPTQLGLAELPVAISDSQQVTVRLLDQDALAIEEALVRAQQGQQVLWIENTVVEAQQKYLDLAARANELGVACGLLHSRFTAEDRQRIEDRWVDLFGKPGWEQRHRQGRILVGTQVLEQSLDIDADFLISRFAPSDMLLQRMGRLWRHSATPRAPFAVCEAWLLAPPLEQAIAAPPQAFGKSAFVYSPYALCRSLEVWQARAAINLPQDIRPVIELTYAQRSEEGAMATWLHELDNGTHTGSYKRSGRKTLRQLARVTLAQAGNTLPENKAQTRYSETDSYEVLLLRALVQLPEQQACRLTLLSGEQVLLPWQRHVLSKRAWRKLSAKLMRQVVVVPERDVPIALPIHTLNKFGLQHCFYLGDSAHDEALLRVALQDESGNLNGVQNARVHAKHRLNYRDDLGYRVCKD